MTTQPTARVTITFDYPVNLSHYPAGYDAAKAIALDQQGFDNNLVCAVEFLDFHGDDANITIALVEDDE